MKRKKKPYLLFYFIGAFFTLILHYFFISKIQVISTIQVIIDIVILTFLTGWTSMIWKYFAKKKR